MRAHPVAVATVVRVVALVALLAGASLLVGPSPAAADPSYVALGDSYSSGVGTRSYEHDGCRRSPHAFPRLIARSQGWSLSFRACTGATVADVRRDQLGGLGDARWVTITIGGNDAGFRPVLVECAQPGWLSRCGRAVDEAQRVVEEVLPERLSRLFHRIRVRAGRARVVVVGYPRLFADEDCNALTWFSPHEQRRLNATADRLNDRLGAAARGHGFGFADPTAAFTGHAVCAATEWVNGLSQPLRESYHPNRAGHAHGYTPLVRGLLVGPGW